MFVLGYGWNFCFVAGSALLTDELRISERGRVQGLSDSVVAVAAGAGALGTGPLFAVGAMTWIAALGLAASLALIVVVTRYSLARRPAPA